MPAAIVADSLRLRTTSEVRQHDNFWMSAALTWIGNTLLFNIRQFYTAFVVLILLQTYSKYTPLRPTEAVVLFHSLYAKPSQTNTSGLSYDLQVLPNS